MKLILFRPMKVHLGGSLAYTEKRGFPAVSWEHGQGQDLSIVRNIV
jgi:hypothetical protein